MDGAGVLHMGIYGFARCLARTHTHTQTQAHINTHVVASGRQQTPPKKTEQRERRVPDRMKV